MRVCLTIAAKDLRQQLRSGTLLVFGLLLPLGLAFLFNAITPDADEGFHATFAVVDDDGGALADEFVDRVLGTLAAEGTFDVTVADSVEQAMSLLDEGEVRAAFVLPAGFTADVEAGRTATLRVIGGADASIAAAVAGQVAEGYATQVRAVQLAVAVTTLGATDADDPADLATRAAAAPPPLVLDTDTAAADRQLDMATHYAAGMAVFFLFFVAMLSVSSVLDERANRTMARLMAAPTSRPAILVGKLLGGVGVGLVAMAVLVAASTLLFGARWGPTVGVAVLVASVVLAATGLMALITTVARTAEQATNWMSVLAVLMGMFGGSFVPLAQLGDLAAVGYATPHRWFLQGLSDLAAGDLSVLLAPVAALLAFAVVGFALTLLRIDKVVRP